MFCKEHLKPKQVFDLKDAKCRYENKRMPALAEARTKCAQRLAKYLAGVSQRATARPPRAMPKSIPS